MSQRTIATVTAAATMCAVTGIMAAPQASASSHARAASQPAVASAAKPKPQPMGPSAFTAAPFTVNPAPAVRNRAVSNAQKAITAHASQAHRVGGDAFAPRTVVVNRDGAADVRFDRTYQGLPVYGGDLIVHLKPDGSYRTLETATNTTGAVPTKPGVSAANAAKASRTQLKGKVSAVSTPRLAVLANGKSSTLVWETVVSGMGSDQTPSKLHVLVSATDGRVLRTSDEVSTFAPRGLTARHGTSGTVKPRPMTAGSGHGIYNGTVSLDLTQSGGTWEMQDPSHGNGYTTDLNHATDGTGTTFSNSTGTFGDGTNNDPASAGADAHYGAAETYDFYKATEGRTGIFGDGRGVPSRTHYGNAYENAFWDGTQMTYGDGANNARPLLELDVAGHEMSHGVSGSLTGWSDTGETGGLNEGTSDIFGTLVEFYANNPNDTPDYTIGELINFRGDGKPLRYMYQPSLDGSSPDCYDSNNGSLDPHYAMGPLSHWFFLLAVGSGQHGYGNSPTCNNSTITGIGNDKAGKIWYKALASYANSGENYSQAYTDSLKAAADLFGTHCTEYNTVMAAWNAVSVTGPDPVPGTCQNQPQNPVVTSPGNQTTTVGTAVNLQIKATDPQNQTLTYSATGLPAGLSINSSSGLISGTPSTAGSSSVTVTAKDTSNLTGSATFTWTVNPQGNGAPTVTSPGDQTTQVGTAVNLTIKATDPQGQDLIYSASGLPAGLQINPKQGKITGTPTAPGTSSVTVTATDTSNLSGSATFTWTITPSGGGGPLVNGDFETGSLSPWTCQPGSAVVTSPVHGGKYALQVNVTGSQTGECDQAVKLTPNHSYTLTAWVQGSYAFAGVSGDATASTWAAASGWTKVTVPFTTGSTGAVTVYVNGWYGQGNVNVDDVSIS